MRRFVRGQRVGVGLADRAHVRHEPEPVEVLQDGRVEYGPATLAIVILDAQEHAAADRPGDAPRPDRVGDVTQVEVAGRGRGEPGQRPARQGREVRTVRRGRRPARSPSAEGPEPARPRRRPSACGRPVVGVAIAGLRGPGSR